MQGEVTVGMIIQAKERYVSRLFCGVCILLANVGCDPQISTRPERGVNDVCAAAPYTDDCLAALDRRAAKGDWQAARDLGLYRMNELGLFDGRTVILLEQWAKHDVVGNSALAEILSRSCSLEDRKAAVMRLKEFMRSDSYRSLDQLYKESHEGRLREMVDGVSVKAATCSDLTR